MEIDLTLEYLRVEKANGPWYGRKLTPACRDAPPAPRPLTRDVTSHKTLWSLRIHVVSETIVTTSRDVPIQREIAAKATTLLERFSGRWINS
jgi:hypothetical protein